MALVYSPSTHIPEPVASSWRAGSLGSDLDAFQCCQGFGTAELAQWLGVDPASLADLASAVRPDPSSLSFHSDCAMIARLYACDAFALRTLLRWVHGER